MRSRSWVIALHTVRATEAVMAASTVSKSHRVTACLALRAALGPMLRARVPTRTGAACRRW